MPTLTIGIAYYLPNKPFRSINGISSTEHFHFVLKENSTKPFLPQLNENSTVVD